MEDLGYWLKRDDPRITKEVKTKWDGYVLNLNFVGITLSGRSDYIVW